MSFLSLTVGPLTARLIRHRAVCNVIRNRKQSLHNSACLYKSDDIEEGPIKFSKSKAAGKRLELLDLDRDKRSDAPPYQTPIVWFSLVVLMMYCLFREPNDWDAMLTLPAIEKEHIKKLIIYKRKQDLPTQELEKRLAEIEAAEKMMKR